MSERKHNYFSKMLEYKKKLKYITEQLNKLKLELINERDIVGSLKKQVRELGIEKHTVICQLTEKQEIINNNFEEATNKEIDIQCLKEHISYLEEQNSKQKDQLNRSDNNLFETKKELRIKKKH